MKTCAGILPGRMESFSGRISKSMPSISNFVSTVFSGTNKEMCLAKRENKSYQRKERGIVQFSGTEGTEAHPERKRFGRDPVSFLQRIAAGT